MKPDRFLIVLAIFALAFLPAFPGAAAQSAPETNAVVGGACDEAAFNAALAIVEASPGGTITFNCGASPFFIVFSGQKSITKNVVIEGANLATLSGGNATRLFLVASGASLTLKNLTVSNGNSGGADAGAIYSNGSLVIDNCLFQNNRTGSINYSGGAILNTGPLTISNSEFINNEGGNGGALFPRWSNAVTTITDSLFQGNQAKNNTTSGWGGAVLLWDGASLTVTASTFSDNWSSSDGGALFVTANSTLSMSGGSMSTNQANAKGGAIYNQGNATISDTLIVNNLAVDYGGGLYNGSTMQLNRVWLYGNYTFSQGGGIFNTGTATVRSSTLSHNRSYWGGGISAQGTVDLLNTTLANNEANYTVAYGGGIYVEGNVILNFVTLVDNTAVSSTTALGQSIFRSSGQLSLRNTIIKSASNACDGGGAVTSLGFNVAVDGSCGLNQPSDKPFTNPQLGTLGYHGGATPNVLPNPGSPALDNGQCGSIASDQRGVIRPQAAACDSGAIERLGSEFASWGYLPYIKR